MNGRGRGVTIEARISPGASKPGISLMDDGKVKIRLSSPPEKGRANKELKVFLGAFFGIAKKDVEIIAGEKSRNKVIMIKKITEKKFTEAVDG